MDEAQHSKAHKHFSLIAIVIVLIGILAVSFLYRTKECHDQECFVSAADNCKRAAYSETQMATTFAFKTKDCTLEKTIIQMSESEPDSIRDMFINKTMTCSFEESEFDQRLVTSVLGGLENCYGELKDAFYELAIAQYELSII